MWLTVSNSFFHILYFKTMLVIGERRVNKLRAFFKKICGIKLPSNEVIRQKENQLMLRTEFTEERGKVHIF